MSDRKKILIIDDEPRVVDALCMILGDSGYDTAAAYTGREGLAQFDKQRCDVAVVDLKLPDMSGLDVLNRLRAEDSKISVIIITGHYTPQLTAEARSKGAFDVLAKPFSPADILNMVRAAIDGGSG
ncbi:MAG: response regulator [Acidobacteriota bacterium]